MKLALQVLIDCVAVSMIVLLFVGLLPGETFFHSFGTLFVEVWLYTILIATPAHVILPRIWPFLGDNQPAMQWAAFIVVLVAISVMASLVGSIAVYILDLEPGVPLGVITSVSVKLALCLAVLVGIIHAQLVMLKERVDTAEARLRTREIEYERELKLAAEARLASLESRVHPHFLFNALNTISSLIPTAPERAEQLVERMSALLRFSLDTHEGGLVPLGKEMKIVRDYLDIEQARFGERLRYEVNMSAAASESGVPPLSVQTLVENSTKHAVAPARSGAGIRIRASNEHNGVRIEVADTGAGFSPADIASGRGLDNLRGRLAMLFGEPEPLRVAREDGWTTVSFRVPS